MTPPSRHLHLVRPASPEPTGAGAHRPDPSDPDITQLIAAATAWQRVDLGETGDTGHGVRLRVVASGE